MLHSFGVHRLVFIKVKFMNQLLRHAALAMLLFAVAGCSTVKDAKDSVTGWFNGDDSADSTISTAVNEKNRQ